MYRLKKFNVTKTTSLISVVIFMSIKFFLWYKINNDLFDYYKNKGNFMYLSIYCLLTTLSLFFIAFSLGVMMFQIDFF